MSVAQDLVKQGDLAGALSALQGEVREAPARPELRIFLFELYSLLGEWQRALTQLNLAGEMAASTLGTVMTYQPAIQCESLRASVFRGERSPMIFGEPQAWMASHVAALQRAGEGDAAAAAALREQAFEQVPETPGTIDDRPIEFLSDADVRIGVFLEAVVLGRYYWIPFCNIAQVHVDAPANLRDLVWLPARFTWINGGSEVGLLPVRYPNTAEAGDDRLRLARMTQWADAPEQGVSFGLGQRMLTDGENDFPLLDIRHIRFAVADQLGAD